MTAIQRANGLHQRTTARDEYDLSQAILIQPMAQPRAEVRQVVKTAADLGDHEVRFTLHRFHWPIQRGHKRTRPAILPARVSQSAIAHAWPPTFPTPPAPGILRSRRGRSSRSAWKGFPLLVRAPDE